MKIFDAQLLRLKQAIKLTEDQDVATLLKMSKAAFSERKKRDAFPEDKVWALATQRPDLHLDVNYVLTGVTGAAQALLDEKEARIARAADAGMGFDEIRAMERAADPASLDQILKLLNQCTAPERNAMHTLLKSIIGPREALGAAQPESHAAKPTGETKLAATPKPALKRTAPAQPAPHTVQNFNQPFTGGVAGIANHHYAPANPAPAKKARKP